MAQVTFFYRTKKKEYKHKKYKSREEVITIFKVIELVVLTSISLDVSGDSLSVWSVLKLS